MSDCMASVYKISLTDGVTIRYFHVEAPRDHGFDDDDAAIVHWWQQGEMSCDCRRRGYLYFGEHTVVRPPCGSMVKLNYILNIGIRCKIFCWFSQHAD